MPETAKLLLVVAAFAAPAPAGAAPLSYDCDTGPGRYSELKRTEPGPAYSVSGRIAAIELGLHKRWLPSGQVVIESADGLRSARLQLVATTRQAPLDVVLLTDRDGEAGTQRLGQVGLNEALAFSMTVAGGRARVEIGTMRGEAEVDVGAAASVGVVCSTGNFHFEDLRLGASDR